MRIAFVTSAWDANGGLSGVGVYRALIPAKALRSAGHEVCIVPNAIQDRSTGRVRALDADGTSVDVDVIVWVAPPPGSFAETIWPARLAGQKIIMDCDDWFIGLGPSHPMRQQVLFDAQAHLRNMTKAMRLADGVIFSTPYLASLWIGKTIRSAVVRNMIDLSAGWVQREQAETPLIGWTGRANFRPDDLRIMRGVLRPFMDENDLRFVHVGHSEGQMTAA